MKLVAKATSPSRIKDVNIRAYGLVALATSSYTHAHASLPPLSQKLRHHDAKPTKATTATNIGISTIRSISLPPDVATAIQPSPASKRSRFFGTASTTTRMNSASSRGSQAWSTITITHSATCEPAKTSAP